MSDGYRDCNLDYFDRLDEVGRWDYEETFDDEVEPPWERFYDEVDVIREQWYGTDEVER